MVAILWYELDMDALEGVKGSNCFAGPLCSQKFINMIADIGHLAHFGLVSLFLTSLGPYKAVLVSRYGCLGGGEGVKLFR